jgi:hypothetical protein
VVAHVAWARTAGAAGRWAWVAPLELMLRGGTAGDFAIAAAGAGRAAGSPGMESGQKQQSDYESAVHGR